MRKSTAAESEPAPTANASGDRRSSARRSTAAWTFPAQPDAAARARAVVRATLAAWGLHSAADTATLLVSELVTNALRHARGPIDLRLERRRDTDALVVEVSDSVPDMPRERPAGDDAESGRGLQLVARSTRRWGTRPGRTGKTVWFELPLTG